MIEGEIELFGDRIETLKGGDTFVVGPGTKHGIRGLAPKSQVINSFMAPIQEYADST